MNVPEQQAEKPKKSRHLSILDFFENLQVEYLQADLRHKIYPKLKDKAYWNRVKEGKRATIEKLAEKNSLPSIFTDEAMLRAFEKRVYREVSYPIFNYRDEKNRMEQEYYDIYFYYLKGADVRIDTERGEILIGKICREYIPFGGNVTVSVNGKESAYSIKTVTRII